MRESFTAGAQRVIESAEARARARRGEFVEPHDLLLALIDETESRATLLLESLGVQRDQIRSRVEQLTVAQRVVELASDSQDHLSGSGLAEPLPQSISLRLSINEAKLRARSLNRAQPAGTEHLLLGLLGSATPLATMFEEMGLDADALLGRISHDHSIESGPIPMSDDLPAPILADPGETDDLARILDASANRAREGLRVVEDYARFVLNDPGLTKSLKDVRHRFGSAVRGFNPEWLISSRDTPGDVGTHIVSLDEYVRANTRAVLTANFKRSAEALRTIEEYTKVFDQWLASRFEVMRYDLYSLEKRMMAAVTSHKTLESASLYVLLGGLPTLGDLTWIAEEAIAGGADVLQYREKNLPDGEVLRRAQVLRELTTKSNVRLIINDRPDLARLTSADGVHLGQDDIPLLHARRIVGPNALIGVSTHSPDQIDEAILEGANYLGVGPVFPSDTKPFDDFPGLPLVRYAGEATSLPWFAIGGINEHNLDELRDAGAKRVAVSSAIIRAERPRGAARSIKARLSD